MCLHILVGDTTIKARVARHFQGLGRDSHADGLSNLVGTVIHGIRKNLFHRTEWVVVHHTRLGGIIKLVCLRRDHKVLDIRERVSQLTLNRAGKHPLNHAFARRVRNDDDLDARVTEIPLRPLGKHEDADVARPSPLGRTRKKLQVIGNLDQSAVHSLFVQTASYLLEMLSHETQVKIVHFSQQIGAVIEGDVRRRIKKLPFFLRRCDNRAAELADVVKLARLIRQDVL